MKLREAIESVIRKLDELYLRREELFRKSRKVLELVRESMIATHNHDFLVAEQKLSEILEIIQELSSGILEDVRLSRAGFWLDATKEFAEALIFAKVLRTIVEGSSVAEIPLPEDMGISEESWILGLAEVAGELKRQAILFLKNGDVERAEKALAVIKEIYSELSRIPYPNSIVPGLKGKVDYVRAMMVSLEEKIVDAMLREKFEEKIRSLVHGR